MRYCFDLDGTLCTQMPSTEYLNAEPFPAAIAEVNRLFDAGHRVIIWTARGISSGIDWKKGTEDQLASWGLKYHELHVGTKLAADVYIDDKGLSALEWRAKISSSPTTGFIAGAFDLLHPGYILAFQEARMHCTRLIVGLHVDPTRENPSKLPPIVSAEYRERALRECRSVDDVLRYDTEAELVELLERVKPAVRFLGSDYRNRPYTGQALGIPIVYLNRSHSFSMTETKRLIAASLTQQGKS